jgi:hypothetical protein
LKRLSIAVPSLLLVFVTVVPLIVGVQTLYLRDVANTHLPLKYSQAEAFQEGYLPLVDPYRGGGQPALGNPNGSMFYPDSLLLEVAHPLWVLNFRFWFHWLVAPFAFYWMARRLGATPTAAWAGAVFYFSSGYFFSQLNFYNLVAGIALTPALIAAVLQATASRGDAEQSAPTSKLTRSGSLIAVAILWALLLLSGDPMIASQALVLAGVAWFLSGQLRLRQVRQWLQVIVALVLGLLMAAPQVLEFQEILKLSYRGHWGLSTATALAASWDPRTMIDFLVPMFFGRPDLGFWGMKFHDGETALYFTLYPGLLALLLMLFSGRPSWSLRPSQWLPARLFAWVGIAGGVFCALGKWNPLIAWWAEQGNQQLRFPIKFWLPVAIGMAVLSGLGFARLFGAGSEDSADTVERTHRRRRKLILLIGILAVGYVIAFFAINLNRMPLEGWLASMMPQGGPADWPSQERIRYSELALLSTAFLAGFAMIVVLARRRPLASAALLLAFHTTTQLLFLRPLVALDDVQAYVATPPLLASLAPGEVVVHAGAGIGSMFGPGGLPNYPGTELEWVQRYGWGELYPFVGVAHRIRYDLNGSPEGLDSFFTRTTANAVEMVKRDELRLRLLRAIGADVLILDRPLAAEAMAQVRVRQRYDNFGVPSTVYQLMRPAREVELVTQVFRASQMNESIAVMVSDGFDPRQMVVLPGDSDWERNYDPAATVSILRQGPESAAFHTSSEVPAVLVWRRSYLPIYRATVDGEEVRPRVANQCKIGIEVPPGEHEVRIFTDRSGLRFGLSLAVLGFVLLIPLGWFGRR